MTCISFRYTNKKTQCIYTLNHCFSKQAETITSELLRMFTNMKIPKPDP